MGSFVVGKGIEPFGILKIRNNYSRYLEYTMVKLMGLTFDKGRIVKYLKLDLPFVYLPDYYQNYGLPAELTAFGKLLLIL